VFDVFLSQQASEGTRRWCASDRGSDWRKEGVIKVWFDEWTLQPGDSISGRKIGGRGWELFSRRAGCCCMSGPEKRRLGQISEWAQLASQTFRFGEFRS